MLALEAGLAASRGTQFAFNAFLTGLAETDYDSIQGDPDDPATDRAWMWQYCSEWGSLRFILCDVHLTPLIDRVLQARGSDQSTFD